LSEHQSQSLEFENLPLLRVEYSIFFEPLAIPTLDEIFALRRTFQDQLPVVSDFSGPVGPINFSVGSGPGVGLDNFEEGLGLAVRQNRLIVAWQKINPNTDYVRFERIKQIVLGAWKLLENRKIIAATGVYANLVNTDQGSPEKYLLKHLFSPLKVGDGSVPTEVRLAWRLATGTFKLFVYPISEGTMIENFFVVEPDQESEPYTKNDPEPYINIVHSELIRVFDSLITKHARDTWKIRRS